MRPELLFQSTMKLEGPDTGTITHKSFGKSFHTSKPSPYGLSAYLGPVT